MKREDDSPQPQRQKSRQNNEKILHFNKSFELFKSNLAVLIDGFSFRGL